MLATRPRSAILKNTATYLAMMITFIAMPVQSGRIASGRNSG